MTKNKEDHFLISACLRGLISASTYMKLKKLNNKNPDRPIRVKNLTWLYLQGTIRTIDYFRLKQFRLRNKRKKRERKPRFSLWTMTEDDCLRHFRFTPSEIGRLYQVLQLPHQVTAQRITRMPGIEAFCIMLCRLSYPIRLVTMKKIFNRSESVLSWTANYMVRGLYLTHGHLLHQLKKPWLTRERYNHYSEVVANAGSPMPNIIGFIDGTCRPICRPQYRQEEFYSGYVKSHVVKYQSIVLPDGLIGRLDGPFVGRRHDAIIMHLSQILPEFEEQLINPDGTWMAIYGDGGYSNTKFVKAGYRFRAKLSVQQKLFNALMSSLRVSVEYGFGRILQQFAFLDFWKNQMFFKQPLREQYYVAALLTNCQTCLRGNQTAKYFNCEPPTLEEYLGDPAE